MRKTYGPFLWIFFLVFAGCSPKGSQIEQVRGWNILSDSYEDALVTIASARDYNINHLQISHQIVMNLFHLRDPERREMTNTLIKKAHDAGIEEVVVWDHALYRLSYYPAKFKTGPDSTINLDNPAFWEWLKQDYREMLDLVPEVDGLVLTFIETGARAEHQYSEKLKSNQEKLAAVVNAVASVVIEERGLSLYARTFAYTHEEYDNIVGAIELFEYPGIRLMMKETPHDFFLTHPNDFFAGTIDRPTIMEFDVGAEFNGQAIIANTWPEYILSRWGDFLKRDHVIGYVARTDRFGDTRVVGRPSEINLYALKRLQEDTAVTAENIYDEFIVSRYGKKAHPYVKAAFKNAFDIVTSVFYSLGTSTANHSQLNYDPYSSHWARHVSGKWKRPPVVFVKHGVNREFHYWTDVINTLAPDWAKAGGTQLREIPWVVENGWLKRGELMNETYLSYIRKEKQYGIDLSKEALEQIQKARPFLEDDQFQELYHYFNRTLLTARLHKATATAYFGYRIFARGETFRSPELMETIQSALQEMKEVSGLILDYPVKAPAGQWDWVEDAGTAMRYYEWITQGTWPERTGGFNTGLNGIVFPAEGPSSALDP